MNAKHQFKYTYSETNLEEYSPVDITFDMPGDVTIQQMLWNFQCYLKACGFIFDGELQVVPYDEIDNELDEEWNEFYKYHNGVKNTSCCEDLAWEGEVVEKFNKKLEKLQAEVKKNKWIQGMCNPPSPDWDKK